MNISRRGFLESAAFCALAAQQALRADVDKKTGMPTRILGKTGARVSIVAFGCGSRLLAYKERDKGVEALNRGIDLGISYLDTAYSYGRGQSEEWVGDVLKTRRNEVFVATKIGERNGDEALRILEGSMKRLQTDRVDLIHIHSLLRDDDLARAEAKDGVLHALYKLREQKVTRFIGVTSHTNPATLKTAIERHDFDCTQMALNVALIGNEGREDAPHISKETGQSFERLALPVALRKKMGVTAMKIFGQEKILGAGSIETLIRYSLSLPVTAAVLGMPQLDFVEQNTRIAKRFKPFSPKEMRELSETASRQYKASLDRYFANHIDA
jgi:uncharacterized protein